MRVNTQNQKHRKKNTNTTQKAVSILFPLNQLN